MANSNFRGFLLNESIEDEVSDSADNSDYVIQSDHDTDSEIDCADIEISDLEEACTLSDENVSIYYLFSRCNY